MVNPTLKTKWGVMMISDSIFTLHRYKILNAQYDEPIYLFPFGDMHRFAPLCDLEKWLEFLEWAKNKPNAYFIGMGDYDDLASWSERKALMNTCLHETTQQTLDDIFVSRVNKLCEEIGFMKGKLIGLVEGNHHGILQSGMTTTQMMCDKLKCKYLGVSAFIRLSFEMRGSVRSCIDMWVHHGKGASRMVGGSLNTVEQMAQISNAQICLMGHDHKKSVGFLTSLYLTDGGGNINLHHRKTLLGRTGSFLKGYVDNCPSYVARGAMRPTDLGVLKIELTPKRDRKQGKDNTYIDLHCSI